MTQAIAVKERPFVVYPHEVRAILDGRQTQFRRVIKPQPPSVSDVMKESGCSTPYTWSNHINQSKFHPTGCVWAVRNLSREHANKGITCPFGKIGDQLWVRETWRLSSWDNDFCDARLEYRADGKKRWVETGDLWEWPDVKWESLSEKLIKRNVFRDPDGNFLWDGECPMPWEPSIFMPRAASRITLRITEVRVERLQDISEEDAWTEGCEKGEPTDNGGFFPADEPDPSGIGYRGWDCATDWFADLWDSINADRGFDWDVNPWVWVVGFEKMSEVKF